MSQSSAESDPNRQQPEYLASATDLSNALAAKLLTAMSKGRNIQSKSAEPGHGHGHHRKTTNNLPNYHQRSWRQPKTPKERPTPKGLAAVPEGDEQDDFSFSFADLQMSETPTHKPTSTSTSEGKKSEQTPTLSIPTPTIRKISGGSMSNLKKPPVHLQKANTKEPLRGVVRRIPSLKATPSLRTLKVESPTPSPSPSSRKSATPTASPLTITRRNTTTGIVTPKGHQRSHTAPSIAEPEGREESPKPPPSLTKTSRNAIVHAYYTILRDRNPGHYLVNLTEEEEEILSQKQYAELLQLACQKARSGEVEQAEMSSGDEDEN